MEVLLITLSVVVVVTNVSVCCMVIFIKKLRTFTNYFVASLAISDILNGGVLLPLNYPGIPISPIAGYFISIIMVSGVANVCAVTWDRYLAVTNPFNYPTKLRRQYKKVLVAIWTCAVAYSLLPLIWKTDVSSVFHKCYLVSSVVFCVIIPYLLIIGAYVQIFRRLKAHMNQLKALNVSVRKRENAKRASIEGKTVNVFLIVVTVFILSWAPVIYMTLTGYVADRPDLIPASLPFASLVILAISSMVNPFLYAFMKRDFRQELLKIFRGRKSIYESSFQSSSQGYFYSWSRRISMRGSQRRRASVAGGEFRKTLSVPQRTANKRRMSVPNTDLGKRPPKTISTIADDINVSPLTKFKGCVKRERYNTQKSTITSDVIEDIQKDFSTKNNLLEDENKNEYGSFGQQKDCEECCLKRSTSVSEADIFTLISNCYLKRILTRRGSMNDLGKRVNADTNQSIQQRHSFKSPVMVRLKRDNEITVHIGNSC